jgi:small-conductance mechanosensitive channel
MHRLIDLINERTPLFPPFGQLAVVAALLTVAWAISRVAGRIAVRLVDRGERRSDAGSVDTGVITSLKQRETAISMIQTSFTYLAFAVALLLSIAALLGARRIETVVGASFLAVLIAFSAQRFLTDVIAGLLMFFEGWFRVGDTIAIEPWNVEGIVERVTLRSITVRGLNGEVMHVPNSEVKATKVTPRGYQEVVLELYASEREAGRELIERVATMVPTGPTHFVRPPAVAEVESLNGDLYRIRARAAVAPGREWLASDFLPDLVKERAPEGLIVHGPVVMPDDELAARRFARAVRATS